MNLLFDMEVYINCTSDTIFKFVMEQWEFNINNDLISDILYPLDIVNNIIYVVINTWISMEKYIKNGMKGQAPTSSGGKMMILGTKGVGKTTLMTGLHLIINRLGENVRSIYTNYNLEEFDSRKGPSELLSGFDGSFTTESYGNWANNNRKGLIFFADEFDTLYDQKKNSIRIAAEILSLGKSNLGYGIISGSSSSLESLAHKKDPHEIKHVNYPNMNHSVYVPFRLNPIRNSVDLQMILQLKGKNYNNINIVFVMTGGVGRYIDCLQDDISKMFIRIPQLDIIKYARDPLYGSIIRKLYVINVDWTSENAYDMNGFTYNQVIKSTAITQQTIDLLIDQHVLFYNEMKYQYEFLIPNFILQLKEYYELPTRLEVLAMEVTLKGWKGLGSAEQVLEPLILRTIVSKNYVPFESNTIIFSDDYMNFDITNIKHLKIDELLNRVIAPKVDKGLDSFTLTKGENNVDILVHIHQIKTGVITKSIRMGTNRSSDETTYLTAIIKKAGIGLLDLLSNLKLAFPKEQFVLNSFSLITNKKSDDDVKQLELVNIDNKSIKFILFEKDDFNFVFEDILEHENML